MHTYLYATSREAIAEEGACLLGGHMGPSPALELRRRRFLHC